MLRRRKIRSSLTMAVLMMSASICCGHVIRCRRFSSAEGRCGKRRPTDETAENPFMYGEFLQLLPFFVKESADLRQLAIKAVDVELGCSRLNKTRRALSFFQLVDFLGLRQGPHAEAVGDFFTFRPLRPSRSNVSAHASTLPWQECPWRLGLFLIKPRVPFDFPGNPRHYCLWSFVCGRGATSLSWFPFGPCRLLLEVT